ncbi:MAG: hypothetical protein SH850_17985 [Planctomycetaceae bacterium]|nr:hypothetical protein [Planctomycetaceae bacterium]
MELVVVHAARLLLVVLIAAVVALAAFVIVRKPWGAGHQGEWFYFAVAVLLVLGWAVGQFLAFGRRLTRQGSFVAHHPIITASDGASHQTWEFRMGSEQARQEAATSGKVVEFKDIQVPFASVLGDVAPNEETLQRLAAETARGATLDGACRTVQPDFARWGWLQRQAYLMLVSGLLEQRQQVQTAGEADRDF